MMHQGAARSGRSGGLGAGHREGHILRLKEMMTKGDGKTFSTDAAPESLQEDKLNLLPGSAAHSWMSWENLTLNPAACHVTEEELGSLTHTGESMHA